MVTMTEILPEDFFNIKQPYSTFIEVQFRMDFEKDKTDPEAWLSITSGSVNDFFQSLNLTDSGGIPQIELNLIDKKFSRLENIIIKSIVGLNTVNSTYQSANVAQLPEGQSSNLADYFRFHLDDTISSNIRIKFGYNENKENRDLETYQNPQTLDEFKERKGKKETVYRTPWMYFKIMHVNFNINEFGLTANLKGISMISNILDKAKLWRRNVVLQGTPLDILKDLETYLNENIEETFEFQIDPEDEPIYIPADEDTEDERSDPIGFIEISLGGEPTMTQSINLQGEPVMRQIASFKSLKTLLNEICGAVFPKYFKNDGSEFTPDEIINFSENEQLAARSARYSYYYEQDGDVHRLVFRYQDPNRAIQEQQFIRNYLWRSNTKSIVKNLNINSELDFALINSPIINFVSSSDSPFLDSVPDTNVSAQQGTQSGSGIKTFNADEVVEALDNTNFALVAGFNDSNANNTTTAANLSQTISAKITNAIANGMFSGTLEIPGDPYFLFDNSLEPFVYLIKITVFRPEYKVNEQTGKLENKKSYLSGNYFIKKINHTIDSNGFNTTLEISKFPTAEEDRDILNVIVD
jgi:hypothetical protein